MEIKKKLGQPFFRHLDPIKLWRVSGLVESFVGWRSMGVCGLEESKVSFLWVVRKDEGRYTIWVEESVKGRGDEDWV